MSAPHRTAFSVAFDVALLLAAAPAGVFPFLERRETIEAGFLCCNLHADGRSISDISYRDTGNRLVPVGTPMRLLGYGRHGAEVALADKVFQVNNDYSRDLDMPAFLHRYLVTQDPMIRIATFPAPIRDAIDNERVRVGMTREQVLMAVGYPVASYTPHLDADTWRFWLTDDAEFRVVFDAGFVRAIEADPKTRQRVVAE